MRKKQASKPRRKSLRKKEDRAVREVVKVLRVLERAFKGEL